MKVVNIRHKEKYDVYIGRGSIFGNPFVIGRDGDRDQVIKKYRDYFYKRIEKDDYFKKQVLSLKGKILACWCSPLPCHGDILIEYLEAQDRK